MSELLTKTQLARRLGIPRTTITALVADKKIPFIPVDDRNLLFNFEMVQDALNKLNVPAEQQAA